MYNKQIYIPFRIIRKLKNVSKADLAIEIDSSEEQIKQIEYGKIKCPTYLLDKFLNYFNVDINTYKEIDKICSLFSYEPFSRKNFNKVLLYSAVVLANPKQEIKTLQKNM